jgi:hypothetical protein
MKLLASSKLHPRCTVIAGYFFFAPDFLSIAFFFGAALLAAFFFAATLIHLRSIVDSRVCVKNFYKSPRKFLVLPMFVFVLPKLQSKSS